MFFSSRLYSLKIFRNEMRASRHAVEQCYITYYSLDISGYWSVMDPRKKFDAFIVFRTCSSITTCRHARATYFSNIKESIIENQDLATHVRPSIQERATHSILPAGHSNECGEIKRAVSQRMGSIHAQLRWLFKLHGRI